MNSRLKKIPRVAIIGRPNVGKSTLINRLCGHTEAIVHSESMITRDRKYYGTEWDGIEFYVLDTGGVDLRSDQRLGNQILNQTLKAIEESDIIVFLVDIRTHITALDEEIADILRKSKKPIIFTGNKWDDIKGDYFTEDYLEFGFGYPIKISSIHGININELLDGIIDQVNVLNQKKNTVKNTHVEEQPAIPSISILGRPNVGKSTLFNTLIKEERVIVDDIEGTTRDSIDSIIKTGNKVYRFIDTAGLKKNKLREEDLEFYSRLRTLRTIEKSDICLVLIDSTKEITSQDQKIVETCFEKGVSVCIVFTKIDLLDKEEIAHIVDTFDHKLEYLDFVPFLKISAIRKKGIGEIFKMIEHLLSEREKKIQDRVLIEYFKDLENSSAVYWKGKKFKIKFIKQVRTSPPTFFVFSNMDIKKKTNIKNYIENNIRSQHGFTGAPIIFKFKS